MEEQGLPSAVVLGGPSLRSLRLCLGRLSRVRTGRLVVVLDEADAAAGRRIVSDLGVEATVVGVGEGRAAGWRIRAGLEQLSVDAAVILGAPACPLQDGGTSLLEAAADGLAQPVTDVGRRLWVRRRAGWDDVETARTLRRRAEGDRPAVPRVDAPVLAGTRTALEACAEEAGGWDAAGWSALAQAAGRGGAVLDDRTWLHVPAPAARAWRAATADLDALERDVRDRALDVVRSLRWSLDVAQLADAGRISPTMSDRFVGAGRLRRRAPSTRLAARVLRRRTSDADPSAPQELEAPGAPRWRSGRIEPPLFAGRPLRQGQKPSVAFVLPALGAYGGVLSVLQLADRLRLRGVRTTVAVDVDDDGWAAGEPSLAAPVAFPGTAALLHDLGPHHLVVGTRWDTWPLALELATRWRTTALAFVQDDEVGQLAEGSEERAAAAAALEAFPHVVVKSRWLAAKVEGPGRQVHRIPLGLDLDVFRPRGRPARAHGSRRVVSPARPGVAHRNFDGTVEAFRDLLRRRADVAPTFYGRPFAPVADLTYEHAGRLSQEGVAELLRSADALVDASTWQGFGRPGLEAMACGLPAVLTPHGGITEYAQHGVNCLTAEPGDPAAVADALAAVLTDRGLAQRLVEGGLDTARDFDAEREADAWAALVADLLR